MVKTIRELPEPKLVALSCQTVGVVSSPCPLSLVGAAVHLLSVPEERNVLSLCLKEQSREGLLSVSPEGHARLPGPP